MHTSRFIVQATMACTLFFLSLLLAACNTGSTTDIDTGPGNTGTFDWQLPATVPAPVVPADNPMTEEKFQLGRHLFYDARLSGNGSQSCSSCHQQALAFSDGLTVSIGSTGQPHPRNAQALVNTAFNPVLTWANPGLTRLEQQIIVPLFGDDPVEHGLNDLNREAALQHLRDEPRYSGLFAAAFPGETNAINYNNVVKALASFVRGLTSFDSAYDRYSHGDRNALSDAARRGLSLFNGERLECFHCHSGYNFSDSTTDSASQRVETPFHNTGLYNIGGTGRFPEHNTGLFEITGIASDMGKFRAPTLRNIARSAPYMHDGSMATLEDVIRFYAAGGRVIHNGPNAGDGRRNPFKDDLIVSFSISDDEIADVVAFLQSLTDTAFLSNPRYSNPWTPTP